MPAEPLTPDPSPIPSHRLGEGRPHPVLFVLVVLVVLVSLALPAAAWDVASDATAEDFHAFHRRFSADAYDYPRHGAAPLGLIGFDIYAEASVDRGFDDDHAVRRVIVGNLTGGALAVARVGVRKGLPGGVDLGVSYGEALGGDVKLASADAQWAILHGGLLSPALSLRVTGTETLSPGTYDLRQYGAELLISKGFTVLTPYGGVGVVHSRGKLNAVHQLREESDNRGVAYAGLTLNLLVPKITIEVEKGEVVQASVRVGIGL